MSHQNTYVFKAITFKGEEYKGTIQAKNQEQAYWMIVKKYRKIVYLANKNQLP